MVSSEEEVSSLEKKLIRQVEFYFGDFNLHRDKFMQNEMKNNDGWFTMDTMLKFQRLAKLCSEPGTILAALKKSKKKLMEIDLEEQKIRRKPSKPVPENNAAYRRLLDQRTVYVKGFPQTDGIEEITEFLEDFGEVDGVQLRRGNNQHLGTVFKGSLFATFTKLEDAMKFLQAPMVYYKDKELEKKTKAEFLEEKEKETAEMRPQRKKKNQQSNVKDEVDQSKEEQQEEVFSLIHVSNLTDETITHIDIKELFQEIGAPSVKFFSRYEKNGPAGYALFTEEGAAENTLKLLTMHKNGCVVSIKSSEEVTFAEISEEDRAKALECYSEFRMKNSRDNKKHRKFGGGKKRRGQQRQHIKFGDGNNGEPKAKQMKAED